MLRGDVNIHPGNVASKRVAQNCGFTFEGMMRGCWFHRGEYHDLEVWSILRDEAVTLNDDGEGRRDPVPDPG
jgi:[ribosomal protein S5]-alanine N-acetyltransferase